MPNIQKLKIFKTRGLIALAFASVMLFVLSGTMINTGKTYADPPNTDLATQKYCKSKISGKAQAGCSLDNMDTIRTSVTDGCKKQKDKQACIENASENIIDKIKQRNPKNKSDFENAMNAITGAGNQQGQGQQGQGGNQCPTNSCGGATPTGQGKNCDSNSNCDLIALYVNPFINILSIIVGLVVTASLIVGGIQYTASGGDSQRAAAAKSRISNTLLALLAFIFLYAFLNFLVPGGLFP